MKKNIGIIVPYRDRQEHLNKFVPHICHWLDKEDIDYHIIIVEQMDNELFNRGKLLNVGYDYAKKITNQYPHIKKFDFTHIVTHDVDMLIERGKYGEDILPGAMHLAVEVEQFGWELHSEKYFGGVLSFDVKSFEKINGYPSYPGYGCEDDAVLIRCQQEEINISRRRNRYASLPHERPVIDWVSDDVTSPTNNEAYNANWNRLMNEKDTYKNNGLNNLTYDLLSVNMNYNHFGLTEPKITHIKVKI